MTRIGFRQVLAIVVVFLVALVLVVSKGVIHYITAQDLRWILIAYIMTALGAMLAIVWHYDTYYEHCPSVICEETKVRDTLEQVLEELALPLGVFIFGAAGIMLRLHHVLTDIQCMPFYTSNNSKEKMEAVSRVAFDIATLVFFCLQLPFLSCLHTTKMLKVKYSAHHTILLIAGADVTVWMYTFFKETQKIVEMDPVQYGHQPLTPTSSLEQACLNFSTAMDIFATNQLEYILMPFTMEFMIVSLEILLHVWLLPGVPEYEPPVEAIQPIPPNEVNMNSQCSLLDPTMDEGRVRGQSPLEDCTDELLALSAQADTSEDGDTTGLLNVSIPSDDSSPVTSCYFRAYCTTLSLSCNIYTAVLTGIVEIVLAQYFILNLNAKQHSINQTTYMSDEFFESTIHFPTVTYRISLSILPSLWAAAHCAKILSDSKKIRRTESRLSGNYIVLALTIGANLILSVVEVVTCVGKLRVCGFCAAMFLGLIEALLYTPQYIAQALLIYFGQRRILMKGKFSHKYLQGLLTYLAMFNFMHWIINTFVESQYLSHRGDFRQGNNFTDVWDVFVDLLLPPCIYFRFTCCILILRVKRLVRETTE